MLVIRFQRRGKKHQPTYRVVVDRKRHKLQGNFVEDLGFYNPHSKEVGLKSDRIQYWLGVGAQPSASVYNLLVSKKIVEGTKIPVHKKSKKEPVEAPTATAPVKEEPKEEAAEPTAEAAPVETPDEAKESSSAGTAEDK